MTEPDKPRGADDILGEDVIETSDKNKGRKKIKTKVRARVISGALLEYDAPPVDEVGTVVGVAERKGALELRQARLEVDARYLEILQVRLSADFADLLGAPDPGEVIRNAWGSIAVHPAFQIKVGNFKRPYSRLELRGASKLPFVGRGLYNRVAVEDLNWGDRAVGVGLWGEVQPARPGLHAFAWALTASNDVISGAPHGVDVHARMTYDPAKWVSIGLSGAFKYVQDPLADEDSCLDDWQRDPGCRRTVFAAGADVVVHAGDLYASAEVNVAQDWRFADESPWMLGALAYASYDVQLAKRTWLQPVIVGEFVDTNLSYAQSEALRTRAGLNLLWTKHLRIMPQAQLVAPLRPITAFNQITRNWEIGLWISVQI